MHRLPSWPPGLAPPSSGKTGAWLLILVEASPPSLPAQGKCVPAVVITDELHKHVQQ